MPHFLLNERYEVRCPSKVSARCFLQDTICTHVPNRWWVYCSCYFAVNQSLLGVRIFKLQLVLDSFIVEFYTLRPLASGPEIPVGNVLMKIRQCLIRAIPERVHLRNLFLTKGVRSWPFKIRHHDLCNGSPGPTPHPLLHPPLHPFFTTHHKLILHMAIQHHFGYLPTHAFDCINICIDHSLARTVST